MNSPTVRIPTLQRRHGDVSQSAVRPAKSCQSFSVRYPTDVSYSRCVEADCFVSWRKLTERRSFHLRVASTAACTLCALNAVVVVARRRRREGSFISRIEKQNVLLSVSTKPRPPTPDGVCGGVATVETHTPTNVWF